MAINNSVELLKDFTVAHVLLGPDRSKVSLDTETTTMINDVLTWILFELQRVSLKIDFQRTAAKLSELLSAEISPSVKVIDVQQMADHLNDRVCFGFVLQMLSYGPIQAKNALGVEIINFQ